MLAVVLVILAFCLPLTSATSWLNMVERFFRTLTDRQIRRGVFTSVKELEARLAGRSCGRNQPSRFSKRLVVLAKRSASRALNLYFTQDTTLARLRLRPTRHVDLGAV